MAQLSKFRDDPAIHIVTGVCPHDCPDTCSWQVAVDRGSGRALDIWGHPDHPMTQGTLCTKVDKYLERTYHPARLTTPLKRRGPKGSGDFVPIGWDDALAEIAARLADEHITGLLAPVKRVAGYDTVMPLPKLEAHYMPQADDIVAAALDVMRFA